EETSLSAMSLRADERFVTTTGHRRRFDPPPWTLATYLPDAPPGEILARHRQRMSASREPLVPFDPAGLFDLLRENARRHILHMIGRGVYVPASGDEIARALAPAAAEARV